MPALSRRPSAIQAIFYFLPDQQLWLGGPTTPVTQRLLAMTRDWFGLFPFRSPLLRESRLLSLPVGTEMFHFPTLPPPALCVQAGAMGHYAPSGFPIRKSPDHSLVAGSPGLIAGSNVLHRLLVPRHPPCALTNLAIYDVMLASTVQFSRYGRSRPCPPQRRAGHRSCPRRPAGAARALRTQQRARPGCLAGSSFRPAGGCTEPSRPDIQAD